MWFHFIFRVDTNSNLIDGSVVFYIITIKWNIRIYEQLNIDLFVDYHEINNQPI